MLGIINNILIHNIIIFIYIIPISKLWFFRCFKSENIYINNVIIFTLLKINNIDQYIFHGIILYRLN